MARIDTDRPAPKKAGVFREFFSGVGLLGRGFARYGRNPKLIVAGLIPALITAVIVLGALALLVYYGETVAGWITPFANHWSSGAKSTVHLLGGIAIVGVAVLLAFVTFTSLTLAIGDPFYERISAKIEEDAGGIPDAVEVARWRTIVRDLVEGVRLLTISALIGIPLFVAGFIPVVGQTVVPVIGALFGGWFLAVELVGFPFARRGMRLRDRRRALRTRRPMAIGFGAAVFVCFLVPFVGPILTMPAAVAGGTLLARRVLGGPETAR